MVLDKEALEREEIRRERQKDRQRERAIQRAAPEKRFLFILNLINVIALVLTDVRQKFIF